MTADTRTDDPRYVLNNAAILLGEHLHSCRACEIGGPHCPEGARLLVEARRQMERRIYVASSWRNIDQQMVVRILRSAGHEVYDFRNPAPGNTGFQWSEIDPEWQAWKPDVYRAALAHPIAERGYGFDFDGMQWANTCVLVLPSGRSAHIEAGWMAGTGRQLYILTLGENEPELMYKLATGICLDVPELLAALVEARRQVVASLAGTGEEAL